MEIDKTIYEPKVKNFSNFIKIIDTFFINKEYKNKHFIHKLKCQILTELNLDLDDKRIYEILLSYHKYNK